MGNFDVEKTIVVPDSGGTGNNFLAGMLAKYGVTLENNVDYDYVYVANMGKADLLKSSITDEQHLALYVKDVVDDVDAGDGEIMREWDAKMTSRGIAVDWEEIL